MGNFVTLVLMLLFSVVAFTQTSGTDPAEKPADGSGQKVQRGTESEEFDKAFAEPLAEKRISLLQRFIANFPESSRIDKARIRIVSSRAELADEKIRSGEIESGIELFKLAVSDTPIPVTEKMFSELLIKFPANLLFRGQAIAAVEVAKLIAAKVSENPLHLLALANFYLSIENGVEAQRLAEKSLVLDPNSVDAYRALGFAYRQSFELEKAANAFADGLAVDPNSLPLKIGFAEMLRALGKTAGAIKLYEEILKAEPANLSARTGRILSMFDAGKRVDAESAMAEFLSERPANLLLLTGAAYWFAIQNEGAKAIEYGKRALALEQRYIWSYVAVARGYMALGEPHSAEIFLVTARKYGRFPTLEYELASSRMEAGFFREAAEGLTTTFEIKNGNLKTKLGGRIENEATSFSDLLSLERQASILQFSAAENRQSAEKLKRLLDFVDRLNSKEATENELISAAEAFIKGDDNMLIHRQLFVASQLLEKGKAFPKILQITGEAVKSVEAGVNINKPAAAVMAEELYFPRRISVSRGESVIVPDIPNQTLIRIIRGRIEEIAGWALFGQGKPDEALKRLKIATSVLPENSAWSRSTMWKTGAVYQSTGEDTKAIDAYILGYPLDDTNTSEKLILEGIYARVNGNLDGLAEQLELRTQKSSKTNVFTNQPLSASIANTENDRDVKQDASLANETGVAEQVIPDGVPVAKPTPKNTPSKTESKIPAETKSAAPVEPEKDDPKLNKLSEAVGSQEPENSREGEAATKNDDKKNAANEKETNPAACEIEISKDRIVLALRGGTDGVFVGIGGGDFREIKAFSYYPKGIEVKYEKEISEGAKRAFFVVKSIGKRPGEFLVGFTASCGVKQIPVIIKEIVG